jgi:hypothetical protein
VSTVTAEGLTTIELLVLWRAGADNNLGIAYGEVQHYAAFERKEELTDATQSALLRLFDLGLVRFVEAPEKVGYTSKRFDLPAMTREELLAAFEDDRNEVAPPTGTDIWYDPTPQGEALLEATPREWIPDLSGRPMWRPWTLQGGPVRPEPCPDPRPEAKRPRSGA